MKEEKPIDHSLDKNDKLFSVNERFMTTKEDILLDVDAKMGRLLEKAAGDTAHSQRYYATLKDLLSSFRDKVAGAVLFYMLEDGWRYEYEITETGITLYLMHACDMAFEREKELGFVVNDASYALICVKAKLLSAEAFGELYGVKCGTVRQWIRRGMLRTAQKAGSEWRIPVLADVHKRDKSVPKYVWEGDLAGVPTEYAFLNKTHSVSISRIPCGYGYAVSCGEGDPVRMDEKAKEKFELFLISHPMVSVSSRCIDL